MPRGGGRTKEKNQREREPKNKRSNIVSGGTCGAREARENQGYIYLRAKYTARRKTMEHASSLRSRVFRRRTGYSTSARMRWFLTARGHLVGQVLGRLHDALQRVGARDDGDVHPAETPGGGADPRLSRPPVSVRTSEGMFLYCTISKRLKIEKTANPSAEQVVGPIGTGRWALLWYCRRTRHEPCRIGWDTCGDWERSDEVRASICHPKLSANVRHTSSGMRYTLATPRARHGCLSRAVSTRTPAVRDAADQSQRLHQQVG